MYIVLLNLKRIFKWISYTTNRKWRDRRNGKNIGKIKMWILFMDVIYGGWGHGILSPHENGEGSFFRGSEGVCFFISTMEDSFIWGHHN